MWFLDFRMFLNNIFKHCLLFCLHFLNQHDCHDSTMTLLKRLKMILSNLNTFEKQLKKNNIFWFFFWNYKWFFIHTTFVERVDGSVQERSRHKGESKLSSCLGPPQIYPRPPINSEIKQRLQIIKCIKSPCNLLKAPWDFGLALGRKDLLQWSVFQRFYRNYLLQMFFCNRIFSWSGCSGLPIMFLILWNFAQSLSSEVPKQVIELSKFSLSACSAFLSHWLWCCSPIR